MFGVLGNWWVYSTAKKPEAGTLRYPASLPAPEEAGEISISKDYLEGVELSSYQL
jgi:hypothetical protein